MRVVGVDIGTTGLKMGVYEERNGGLEPIGQFAQTYGINTYNNGQFSDVEPEKWQDAFAAGCAQLEMPRRRMSTPSAFRAPPPA